MKEQIIEILSLVITLVGSIVAARLAAYLKKRGLLNEIESKQKYAEIVVAAIQQMYDQADGHSKFVLAKMRIIDYFNTKGIRIDQEELELLIESAVKGMKEGVKDGNS